MDIKDFMEVYDASELAERQANRLIETHRLSERRFTDSFANVTQRLAEQTATILGGFQPFAVTHALEQEVSRLAGLHRLGVQSLSDTFANLTQRLTEERAMIQGGFRTFAEQHAVEREMNIAASMLEAQRLTERRTADSFVNRLKSLCDFQANATRREAERVAQDRQRVLEAISFKSQLPEEIELDRATFESPSYNTHQSPSPIENEFSVFLQLLMEHLETLAEKRGGRLRVTFEFEDEDNDQEKQDEDDDGYVN